MKMIFSIENQKKHSEIRIQEPKKNFTDNIKDIIHTPNKGPAWDFLSTLQIGSNCKTCGK